MNALEYARELIRFETVSHLDNGQIATYLEQTLRGLGFETERVPYRDAAGVEKHNVIGRKGPAGPGGLAYFGHSDVVPADDWHDAAHGPFDPVETDGKLYGRGSCDMKGSVAAMIAAADRLVDRPLSRPLYIVITADEEVGYVGARHVAAESAIYQELRDGSASGIIGEPTILDVVVAHKGSCGMHIESHGEAAHSSSASGKNANLAMIPFLSEMLAIHDETESLSRWQNPRFDPPTLSWNIGINDGAAAINVKPPKSLCTVYFRPMPDVDSNPLVERTRAAAERHGLQWELFFEAEPFTTPPEAPIVGEMLGLTGNTEPRHVCYGTDAAIFAECRNLVVCGPGDIAQAHTRDEFIALDQLERGTEFFQRAIEFYCNS